MRATQARSRLGPRPREARGTRVVRTALESLLKRRFFVVHLALSAIAALFLARTVTSVVGNIVAQKLQKPAVAGSDKKPARPPRQINRDFEGAAEANIFEGKREVFEEQEVATGPAPMGDGDECDSAPKSSLRLRLVGTVVFSEPEFSIASIVDEGKSGSGATMHSINECESAPVDPNDPDGKLAPKPPPCAKVGDSAVLRRIEAERVCLWNDGDRQMEYLALNEPPDKGPAVATTKKDEKVADAGDADIRKVGENSYEVGQGEVDKALSNLSELATQARVVPAFEGGKTVGFKLFSIRPGSLYSKVGLQNGDVITRINGYEVNSPEKGLEIYGKLKDAKQVAVDLKRRGKPMSLDYAIK
jgi:general secretion pathway protein C